MMQISLTFHYVIGLNLWLIFKKIIIRSYSHIQTRSLVVLVVQKKMRLNAFINAMANTLQLLHCHRQTINSSFVQDNFHCKEQNGLEFGCVTLSPLRLFTGDPTYWEQIPDIISARKLIRASGLPNFWGLRIPVHTPYNDKAWIFHLSDYWDQKLLDIIEYGFPLDFDRSFQLGHMF